ncbi:MAG: N-methyl-D-aspartate receptor NMDAR2C subunit [Comamonadaceae bacterium]|nr:N-methyl-D-aspartate receptor NMDAR2C subunit [Comamonadaceae bacterium]
MNAYLSGLFQDCWQALGAGGDEAGVFQRLMTAYQEPQRRYHTLEHLSECMALFDDHRHLAAQPAEVEMALWFHDAVYDVKAHDNEARSAQWAESALNDAGVGHLKVQSVVQHILATRHADVPQPGDQALLVDVDMAILGAPRARFDAYEDQVRAEYAWVPEPVFRQKRSELLTAFLARPFLYGTPALHAMLEAPARANLAHSLKALQG